MVLTIHAVSRIMSLTSRITAHHPSSNAAHRCLQVDRPLSLLAYLTQVVAASVLRVNEAELEVEHIEDDALRSGIDARFGRRLSRFEVAHPPIQIR